MSNCYNTTPNASIDAPKVSVFDKKKEKLHSHLAVVLGGGGGVLFVLITVSISVFLYIRSRRNKEQSKEREGEQADLELRNWNAAKTFSYREIKAATRNFKKTLGRGSFGSVYLGKLPDGKQTAVKVRFDKTKLGADSFINEVCSTSTSKLCMDNTVECVMMYVWIHKDFLFWRK